ncbi:unnamed protein product [Diamesa hyperborea]
MSFKLNSVLRLNSRQSGNFFERQYDSGLSRLIVQPWDNWKGISPSGMSTDFNPDPPIFAAKFANVENYSHILALANEDGRIALQNTFVKNSTMDADLALEGDQCHHNAVFDIAWMPYHLKLVSASGDHTAKLWDVTESKLIRIREFCGHTRSVKVATFRKNDCSVFATGGRDGAILVWDLRSSTNQDVIQKVDNRIYSAHVGGPTTPQSNRRRGARNTTPKLPPNVTNSSVTGLVFQDEHTLISCGPGDGIIKVWDLRRCYSTLKREPIAKHTLPYAGKSTFKGFTNLVVDDGCRKLYANCMDSNIYCYNISSYSKDPVMTYTGLQNNTFYIKSCLSPDGNYLLSGSSDEKAYIWNLKNPQPMIALTGHNFEVTCVAWSQHQNNLDGGNMCVVTCSDDACHKIWRIGPEELQEDEKLLLRGKAELHKDYYSYYFGNSKKPPIKSQFKMLESTPRSLKRLIELSETTPTAAAYGSTLNTLAVSQATLSSSRKRSFSDMIEDAEEMEAGGSDVKRPNIETRGRRLFSPYSTVDNWMFMKSPSSVLSILSIYLIFVTKLGPKLMESRKAFELKSLLIVFNASLVIFSLWLAAQIFFVKGAWNKIFKFGCLNDDDDVDKHNLFSTNLQQNAWWYFISKLVELFDTVFFVLRKKQNQVSFLHVYHHTITALFSWGYLKYLPGEQGALIGFLNTFVHIFMYFYYFLAALGPRYKKYLFWKKYMTWLQLIQFGVMLIYLTVLTFMNCKLHRSLTIFFFTNTLIFLCLFANFYRKSYGSKLKNTMDGNNNLINKKPQIDIKVD